MGDDLPDFDCELEVQWCLLSPSLDCLDPGDLVEGTLNFRQFEGLEASLPTAARRPSAATYTCSNP